MNHGAEGLAGERDTELHSPLGTEGPVLKITQSISRVGSSLSGLCVLKGVAEGLPTTV